MATVIITHTPVTPLFDGVRPVCPALGLPNAAADNVVFEGSYYDTNATQASVSIEDFFVDSVAHPVLIKALKQAYIDGVYEFETDDDALIMFLEQVAPEVVDQGYQFEITAGNRPPLVKLTFEPSKLIYDVVEETLSSLDFTVKVTKRTNPIQTIKLYVDGAMVKEFTDDVENGGTFNYTHTFDPATNNDPIELKAEAEDVASLSGEDNSIIRFVGKSYFGVLGADIDAPTEDDIKGLENNELRLEKAFEYKGFSFPWGKVCYTYPKSFGELDNITDKRYGINYNGSFTKTEVTVDGVDYFCYTLTDPTGIDDGELTFE